MAGIKLANIFRQTNTDSKRDKDKNDTVVQRDDSKRDMIGCFKIIPIEKPIPEEFQNQIKAIFSERKEGKFLPGSPVETRKKSEKGPTIAKGLSTAEILAMMRGLCLPGNPWDVYTNVRVCFHLSPAWVSQYLLHIQSMYFAG